MDDNEDFKPITDPGVAEAVNAALSSTDLPEPTPPVDNIVTLPGGLKTKDGSINEVEVRELTGEHEEILARAALAKPNNLAHFVNTMLECGVVRFGFSDPKETKKHLKNTLVGDRDAILIGIRKATYGDIVKLERWICPSCGDPSDLTVPLEDIPVTKLEGDEQFDVPLVKGGHATVRLANGGDQIAVYNDNSLTPAERDTILLSRCLLSITDKDGNVHQTVGMAGTYARSLNMADRHEILREINKRQPGPKLGELKITHNTCSNEVELLLSIADLFRDIVLG
jgi:hypothetical protein